MKKRYARSALGLITALFLFAQPVEACTGFIIGKKVNSRWECFVRTYGGLRTGTTIRTLWSENELITRKGGL